MKKFIALLKKNGYTQAPWDKCPKGFEEANYPCYQHKDHNVWIELYVPEKYGHVFSPKHPKGAHFDSVEKLEKYLP